MPVVNYLWDEEEDNIIAEYDENGNVIVEYTTEPGLHGAVISEHRNGQTYYHHHDGQGNLRALTNDQGEVTDTFSYTANGELTERTGTTPTPFQFGGEHGYYTDQSTGEIMVRRRQLSARSGRWLSQDPLEFVDGTNLYQYVRNNPIVLNDPSAYGPLCGKCLITHIPVQPPDVTCRISGTTIVWPASSGHCYFTMGLTRFCVCAGIPCVQFGIYVCNKGKWKLASIITAVDTCP